MTQDPPLKKWKVGVAVAVAVSVAVGLKVEVAVWVGVIVGVRVAVGLAVEVGVCVMVLVAVRVGVAVEVAVGVRVGERVGVPVDVTVGVFAGVRVVVTVGVWVAVGGVEKAVFVGVGAGLLGAAGALLPGQPVARIPSAVKASRRNIIAEFWNLFWETMGKPSVRKWMGPIVTGSTEESRKDEAWQCFSLLVGFLFSPSERGHFGLVGTQGGFPVSAFGLRGS